MIFPNPQKNPDIGCVPYKPLFIWYTHTHTPIVCTCLDDFQTVVDSLTSPRGLCFLPMNPPPPSFFPYPTPKFL